MEITHKLNSNDYNAISTAIHKAVFAYDRDYNKHQMRETRYLIEDTLYTYLKLHARQNEVFPNSVYVSEAMSKILKKYLGTDDLNKLYGQVE